MRIASIRAREILDSRGNPTVEADVLLENGAMGRASVPSGASTGMYEAHELRDGDKKRYGGKGVLRAVAYVNTEIATALTGMAVEEQGAIDERMIALDGTPNKSRLGANAILGVSLAAAKAAALSEQKPLYEYIHGLSKGSHPLLMPLPQCNVINGGAHTSWETTDFQEFMILPAGAKTFSEALRMLSEVFHMLKQTLQEKGYGTMVGDEGGYAPFLRAGNREAFELIVSAISAAGYAMGKDFVFALDSAASELFKDGRYELKSEKRTISSAEMIDYYGALKKEFPIASIEDGLDQNDWEGWKALTSRMGENTQLVGDDLLVTNVQILERAIAEKAANAILIKVNQIGTLTETIAAVETAHAANWRTVISHRSGETEDITIAHLAVGLGSGQIKTGSVSRSERTAKYNELLRIEEMLGESALCGQRIYPSMTEKLAGRLILVRHAESAWNALGKWTGMTDVSLSAKGFKDSALLGVALRELGIPVHVAYCSNLARSRETLESMLEAAHMSDVRTEASPAINERNYGIYTGKNKWEIKKQIGEKAFMALRRGWDAPVPDGETLKDVYERVIPFYRTTVLPLLQEGKNVAIVAHGNSLRALLKYVESVSDEAIADLEMRFGRILVYEVSPKGLKVSSIVTTIETEDTHA